jgi:bis(5'-nucleosyl)-tetraphosphatase (symmetrical)
MSTFVVGDVQGCFEPLQAVLSAARFDAARDRLIFLGDLVNRGPQSAEVLQFAMGLGERAVVLLGNHDLHLLAVAEGLRPAHRSDTLDDVLRHPRRAAMIDWLRTRSLAHREGALLLVHAGVLPQWSAAQTLALAREVEAALAGAAYRDFLAQMYGNLPARWHDGLRGAERLRVIVNALTRLRFCTADGEMEFDTKDGAAQAPPGYMPWFDVPGRASAAERIAFGHWSTLGLLHSDRLVALDTGCVWGGPLSLLRLASGDDDERLFQVPCRAAQTPGRTRP